MRSRLVFLLSTERVSLVCKGRKVEHIEKGERRKGRWKVSVRNASLLEDNLRAGPVCFKSNQSIHINYDPPCPLPPTRARARTHREQQRGGWSVCFFLSEQSQSSTQTVTRPTPTRKRKIKEPIKIKL